MFKKLNNKLLIIVFIVLLALVVLLKFVQHSKGDRNFTAKLFEADTAKISAIIIIPRGSKEEVRIVRNGKQWNLVRKGKTYKTEKNAVESMLNRLQTMKSEYVAAMDKSEWAQYQVTDTSATRVKVEQAGKVVTDILVGKFSYTQNQQTTYVRPYNEDYVYAVNGFLAMLFNRDPNDYRDKSMVKLAGPNSFKKLEFSYPDSSFTLVKEKNTWTINGRTADSTKVANYLSALAFLSGSDFVDDAVTSGNQVFSLKIEPELGKPVELKAFVADTLNKYVVTTTENLEGRFSGTKSDLAKRIFVGMKQFIVEAKGKTKK
jgi:hypothetical protein